MKYQLFFALIICPYLFMGCLEDVPNSSYVDPLIGTDATHFISEWRSEACTYPGAVAPHGMVQISPETSKKGDFLQGYYFTQDTIRRFSLTEHFSGWPDGSKGKVTFMPFSLADNKKEIKLSEISSVFSHVNETARAGSYSVWLDDPEIQCAFTALTRSVIGKLDFKKNGTPGIIISDVKTLEQLSNTQLLVEIKAGSQYISSSKDVQYLILEFNTNFSLKQVGREYQLTFPNVKNNQLFFKYGASYTSAKNAKLNLKTEIPEWDFKRAQRQSEQLWEDELKHIDVKGSEGDKTIFYTALYHASLIPINATDVNRQFPGMEENEPLRDDETHYIYFTPWDAFRTTYPLLNLIHPQKGRDYLRSSLRYYKSAGRIPEPEVMTGVHFTAMFADALAKDITDFNIGLAYEGLKELLWEKPYFRKEIASYDSLGYVPFPESYATTATLEFAFNDWALSQVAEYLSETEVSKQMLQRSFNYRNNYHPQERFMLSKNRDGSWAKASVYAEANKWNMSWLAPHNTQDLINLMGGDSAFCAHLNTNFADGHFVLDNECPLNFPFLFSYARHPWLTLKWKHYLMREYFNETPKGIPGNDDWGSISSWFTWGALGLFPASPGTDELILTSPIFEEITIHFDNGEKLTIEAPNVTNENFYIQECYLNGQAYDKPYIKQDDLLKSGHIHFEMGNTPNKLWASGEDVRPFSVTKENPDFEVVSFKVSKSKVKSNEIFTAEVKVKNKGDLGSYELKIQEESKLIYSEWILFESGEEKKLTIPLKLYRGGKHNLQIKNSKTEIEVVPVDLISDEAFVITKHDIKQLLRKNEEINLSFEVKNISGFEKTFQAIISIDGINQKELEPVQLKPGESNQVCETLKNTFVNGFHWLKINSGPRTRFKVYEKPEESLVLHYKFNKKQETISDHSGFGNHGKVVGGLEFVEGVNGKGIRIIDGYVEIPDSKSLDIKGEEMTMLAWYKPGKEKGMGSIITRGTHNMMKMSGKWQIKTAIGGWGRGQCAYNSPPSPKNMSEPEWLNEWTCFATVKNAESLKLYSNGELKHQLEQNGPVGNTEFEWRIGDNSEKEGQRKPEGLIDEVMIFQKALTVKQIQHIINNIKVQR